MFMSVPMEMNCINIPGNNEDFYKKLLNKFQLTTVTIFKLLTNRWKIKYTIYIHEHTTQIEGRYHLEKNSLSRGDFKCCNQTLERWNITSILYGLGKHLTNSQDKQVQKIRNIGVDQISCEDCD